MSLHYSIFGKKSQGKGDLPAFAKMGIAFYHKGAILVCKDMIAERKEVT